eukprot:symbB.v1.2.039324.t1/scaffold6488.1/size17694/1
MENTGGIWNRGFACSPMRWLKRHPSVASKARHPKLKRNLVVELRLSSDNKN